MKKRIEVVAAVAFLFSCGGQQVASKNVGPQGGSVSTQSGLRIDIPAGALSDDTQVTVVETELQNEHQVELEPGGLKLNQPVTVSMPEDVPGALEAESTEQHNALEVRHRGNRAELELPKFDSVTFKHSHAGEIELSHSDGGEDPNYWGAHSDAGDDPVVTDAGEDTDGGADRHGGGH